MLTLLTRLATTLLAMTLIACGGSRGDGSPVSVASSMSSQSVTNLIASSVASSLSTSSTSSAITSAAVASDSSSPPPVSSLPVSASGVASSSSLSSDSSRSDHSSLSSSFGWSSSVSNLPSISGRITTQSSVLLDTTLNEPLAPFSLNDSLLNAQAIANLSQVQGFATSVPVGVGRFAQGANNDDFYYVRLLAGQIIRLRVVDINRASSGQFTRGDLDLFVYSGTNLNLVGYAMSANEYEEVLIPRDGIYYINVKAYAGSAKYFLSLLAGKSSLANSPLMLAAPVSAKSSVDHDFKIGEAIVDYASATLAMASATGGRSQIKPGLARVNLNLPKRAIAQASAMGLSAAVQATGLDARDTLIAIKRLREDPAVRYAEPNFYRHTFNALANNFVITTAARSAPNDPGFMWQWHLRTIQAPAAWTLLPQTNSRPVTVAVIDTGVVMDHPELSDRLVPGYDFIRDDQSAGDGDGIDDNPDDVGASVVGGMAYFHGTHVAGLIGARHNNQEGGVGVAPSVNIMPIRYLGKNGGTSYDLIQSLRYAGGLSNDSGRVPEKPADIVNLSLGSNSYSLFEQQTIDALRERGILIVAAAGNAGTNETMYPAGYRGVIAVGATTGLNLLGSYSNYGSTIDLVAPGGDLNRDVDGDGFKDGIFSSFATLENGVRTPSYLLMQGTSMAAPQVAGVLANMLSIHSFTPAEMDYLINNNFLSDDIGPEGRDNVFGNGLLNATKAVAVALQYKAGEQISMPDSDIRILPEDVVMADQAIAYIRVDDFGAGDVRVTQVVAREDWLSINATQDIDARGLGNYVIRVERDGLAAGVYSGLIEFELSDGNRKTLALNMTVANQGVATMGAQPWVALMAPDLTRVHALKAAEQDTSGWRYRFDAVAAGRYVIIGGSDIDADSIICVIGETCGGVGGMSTLNILEISGDAITQQDFSLQLLTNLPRLQTK